MKKAFLLGRSKPHFLLSAVALSILSSLFIHSCGKSRRPSKYWSRLQVESKEVKSEDFTDDLDLVAFLRSVSGHYTVDFIRVPSKQMPKKYEEIKVGDDLSVALDLENFFLGIFFKDSSNEEISIPLGKFHSEVSLDDGSRRVEKATFKVLKKNSQKEIQSLEHILTVNYLDGEKILKTELRSHRFELKEQGAKLQLIISEASGFWRPWISLSLQRK